MYYKDEKIEIRLGLGIKSFKSVTASIYTFILSRINEDKSETFIEEFTTNRPLSIYPKDGKYKIEVSKVGIDSYYVFLNINDNFIAEFVKQVKDVVCNCKCSSKCKNSDLCRDNLNGNFAIKRQKLFNTTLMLPTTIKPFSYGQGAVTNPALYNFIQMFFNETIEEKKAELGKEYFDFYTKGTVSNNAELFNSIIAGNYYAFYLYSKALLLNNTIELVPSPVKEYTSIIDAVFEYAIIKKCLNCYIANINFDKIIQDAFIDTNITITASDQNNISRTITVYESDLSGIGTLEDQIAAYVNNLNYDKAEIDSDIWIEFIEGDKNDIPADDNESVDSVSPLIITGNATNITQNSFTLGADPIRIGTGSSWGQSQIQVDINPDFSNYVTQSSPNLTSLDAFTTNFKNPLYAWGNLAPNTLYYYRAKMGVNPPYEGENFWYGEVKTVITLP
jgi:hypothetical protein